MGITKKKDGGLLVCTSLLKVFPVYLKNQFLCVAAWSQHTLRHFTTVISDRREETIIVRRENKHFLSGHGQSLDST